MCSYSERETAHAAAFGAAWDGARVAPATHYKVIRVLGTPDEYDYQDPLLVSLLRAKVPPKLGTFQPAQGKESARLTVFTDISCGYCRKLHREVPTLQAGGVTVTYIPFPRSGSTGASYQTMRKVWCSADRSKAMDIAKGISNGDFGRGDCKEADAVKAGYELGIKLGINGTPAIAMPDGRLQPGYLPADRLLRVLGLHRKNQES